ncbi:DNA-binding transcriptional regulator, MarR family [Micromonospora phaseoli]|uniref:DNA-binding transcriptional regulator, MarR family n=2 Tax=Micromonospora phaseoli TaxID=1144548 RepID=A0A1H7CJD1_9ACTN|nr:MarR family transcriptional regulator [Micromonospora phaseoli]PZV97960.1 DNA-binding MarR family transcriptional regulator [Micromonospora phaseoli]GIJ78627.1 putative HTH-type transcriptional regulator YcgE [Micromonospora phaseoli]SEJ86750.1 DNA-binding transcriptional regulator, MarR family [Micromonospora phaseoli]
MSKNEIVREVAMGVRLLQQSFDAFDEAAATALKLNRTDLRALDLLLSDDDALSAGELSAALKLSPAATTTVIDRLERAGLAGRIQDPHNRRRVLVAATEAARKVERDIYLPVGVAGAEALAGYTIEQLATILDFLRVARQVQDEQATRVRASRYQSDHA